ncbi:uncharacterized protein [Ptychodera flava]|uniref:uncharacterized protein n=1 Tax=Ptychodera flava TaxID=63121 RepID=UPI00396A6939
MSQIDYSKWDKLEVSSSEDEHDEIRRRIMEEHHDSYEPDVNSDSEPSDSEPETCCNCPACRRECRMPFNDRSPSQRPNQQQAQMPLQKRSGKRKPLQQSVTEVEKKRGSPTEPGAIKPGTKDTRRTFRPSAPARDDGDNNRRKRGKKKSKGKGNASSSKEEKPWWWNNNNHQSGGMVPMLSTTRAGKEILDSANIPSFERVDKMSSHWGRLGRRMMYMAVAHGVYDSAVHTASGDTCALRVTQHDCQLAGATGLTRPYSRPKFVKVHPLDNLSTLHPVFYNDPDEFIPCGPDPATKHFEIWGLHKLSWYTDKKVLNRRRDIEQYYSNDWFKYCATGGGDGAQFKYRGLPEVQFVERLIEKKAKCLSSKSREFLTRDYILKVSLSGIRPEIYRRFKVSGGVSLHSLHDKILNPIMGWFGDYHSYCFVDQTDGAVYGPVSSSAIDSMFVYTNGYKFYDDKKVQLGIVLQKRGDKLLYLYDLGDQWEHIIKVESVLSEEVSDGACRVTDAAMNCPIEDSFGLEGKGNPYYQEFLDKLPKQKKWRGRYDSNLSIWARGKLREMAKAFNVSDPVFDPFECNLASIQEKLKEVLSNSIRNMSEPKGKSKDVGVALCCYCGNPNNLHLCSGCRMTFYCCRDCQREHWNATHRSNCSKLADEHDFLKAVKK